jgi:hypothetical protein
MREYELHTQNLNEQIDFDLIWKLLEGGFQFSKLVEVVSLLSAFIHRDVRCFKLGRLPLVPMSGRPNSKLLLLLLLLLHEQDLIVVCVLLKMLQRNVKQ